MTILYIVLDINDKKLFYNFFNINNNFNNNKSKYILKINNENIHFFKNYTKYTKEQIKYILLNNW